MSKDVQRPIDFPATSTDHRGRLHVRKLHSPIRATADRARAIPEKLDDAKNPGCIPTLRSPVQGKFSRPPEADSKRLRRADALFGDPGGD